MTNRERACGRPAVPPAPRRAAFGALLALSALGCGRDDGSGAAQAGDSARASAAQPWEHERSDLAPDPRLHFGSLENGLRWAWVETDGPRWIQMGLMVSVGSLAEEDDELGMAHFVEHMAFNGTEHHPPGTLVRRFQSWGAEIGPDLNATTGERFTYYRFQVPAKDPSVFEFGVRLLRDFAFGHSLLPGEVEAEKAVIDSEERESDRPEERVQLRTQRELYPDSRATHRPPLGRREVRAGFTPEALRAFLRKWYRPERMTLIVAGRLEGLDPDAVIRSAFADVVRPEEPLLAHPEPGAALPVVANACVHEPGLGYVWLQLSNRRLPVEARHDRARLEQELVLDVARRMLAGRLSARGRAPDAPFFDAIVEAHDGAGLNVGEDVLIGCAPERWREALAVAEQELRRALEHGFTQDELEAVRAELARELDDAAQRAPDLGYPELAVELTRAACEAYVPLSATARRELLRPVLERTPVAEYARAFAEAWSDGQRGLLTMGNLDLGPDAGSVLALELERIRSVPVEPWEAPELESFAYASQPGRRGEIALRAAEGSGVEGELDVVLFENGVRLALMKTSFEAGEIAFEARLGEGGLGLGRAGAAMRRLDAHYFVEGGLAAHDYATIERMLAGRAASLEFRIEDDCFAFHGMTSSADLQRQLELFCAYLSAPGWRPEPFELMRSGLPAYYDALARGPDLLEGRFLDEVFAGDPRGSFPTLEQFQAVRLLDVRAWLEPFLADGPLEVALVGELEIEAAVEAAARTLGVLPPRRAPRPYTENRSMMPPRSGIHHRREMDAADDMALVLVVYPMLNSVIAKDAWRADLLGEIVADRLRVEIREELGAAYSPVAYAERSLVVPAASALYVDVRTAPADAERVLEACLELGERLARDGASPEEVRRLRTTASERALSELASNRRIAEILCGAQGKPRALEEEVARADFLKAVRSEDLAELAALLARAKASTLIVQPRAR